MLELASRISMSYQAMKSTRRPCFRFENLVGPKFLKSLSFLILSVFFRKDFIIYNYFIYVASSGDVINEVTHRIFNIKL